MSAKTQYNDLIGTVAADISDFMPESNFQSLLLDNYDPNRYLVVGFDVWTSGNRGSVALLCRDKSCDDNTLIEIETQCDLKEFLDYFKRFNLRMCFKGYESYEIK